MECLMKSACNWHGGDWRGVFLRVKRCEEKRLTVWNVSKNRHEVAAYVERRVICLEV